MLSSCEPKVLLMDEPLSNLDAKLRTQMRVELAGIHKALGNTIIYVTHDQTEAMYSGRQDRSDESEQYSRQIPAEPVCLPSKSLCCRIHRFSIYELYQRSGNGKGRNPYIPYRERRRHPNPGFLMENPGNVRAMLKKH